MRMEQPPVGLERDASERPRVIGYAPRRVSAGVAGEGLLTAATLRRPADGPDHPRACGAPSHPLGAGSPAGRSRPALTIRIRLAYMCRSGRGPDHLQETGGHGEGWKDDMPLRSG